MTCAPRCPRACGRSLLWSSRSRSAPNSDDPTYQALHEQMLEYLRFLRNKAATGPLEAALIKPSEMDRVSPLWLNRAPQIGGHRKPMRSASRPHTRVPGRTLRPFGGGS